tara:strand:+ start:438 stop:680 length:243 start_codon:yes stop_codon:yes gene_type:complete
MSTSNIIEKMVYIMGQHKFVKNPKNIQKQNRNSHKGNSSNKKMYLHKNIAYSLRKKYSETNLNEFYNKYINLENTDNNLI